MPLRMETCTLAEGTSARWVTATAARVTAASGPQREPTSKTVRLKEDTSQLTVKETRLRREGKVWLPCVRWRLIVGRRVADESGPRTTPLCEQRPMPPLSTLLRDPAQTTSAHSQSARADSYASERTERSPCDRLHLLEGLARFGMGRVWCSARVCRSD